MPADLTAALQGAIDATTRADTKQNLTNQVVQTDTQGTNGNPVGGGRSTGGTQSQASKGEGRGRPESRASRKVKSAPIAQKLAGTMAAQAWVDTSNVVSKIADSVQFLGDLVDKYKGTLKSAPAWLESMNKVAAKRRELEQKAESIVIMANKLKTTARIDSLIADATIKQQWPYDPMGTHGVKGERNAVLGARFDALHPEEQAIVKAIFQHGEDMAKERFRVFKALDMDAESLGFAGKLVGPYAPLKRFGNWVGVLRSAELQALEAAEVKDEAKIEAMKQDPEHYVVQHFDTKGQAYMFAHHNNVANGGKYAFTDQFEKTHQLDSAASMPERTLQKVMARIGATDLVDKSASPESRKEAEAVRDQIEKVIREMYQQTIDEKSARAAGLQRLNRAGFDSSMLRSFLANARAQAGMLSNLEFGKDVNQHYYAMQRETKNAETGKYDGMDGFNVLSKHYQKSLDFKETPIQNAILGFTSIMQLATSPAYHLANAMQPIMVTIPRLAADFKNYGAAVTAMTDAYKILKVTGVTGQLNIDAVKNEGLRGALKMASDAGVLDVGLDEDLSHMDRFNTGYGAVDKGLGVLQSAQHKLRQVSRAVEATNRVSTVAAAYNLAISNKMSVKDAQAYALKVVQQTQGDFSANASPLLMKQLPKFLTQYRKFQFMMGAVYVKAFKQAFMSSDPSEKEVGRRMLTYMLGHAFMAGGLMGLPLVPLVSVLGALFGDDDEPWDNERKLRELVGEDAAQLLAHGPLSFLGLDAKLAQDKIFLPFPYTDFDFSSKAGIAKTVTSMMGPSMSQGMKMAEGFNKMADGDYAKGLEGLMPSGITNALKAYRVANEGFTLRNGDLMVKPEDISGASLLMDALGLKGSDMRRMDWMRSQQYEINKFFGDQTSEIRSDYIKATKDGNVEQAVELRQKWMELQSSKDNLRKYFGDSHEALKKQPLSTLLKAPHEQMKRERKLQASAPMQ